MLAERKRERARLVAERRAAPLHTESCRALRARRAARGDLPEAIPALAAAPVAPRKAHSTRGASSDPPSVRVHWKDVVAGATGGCCLTLFLYPLNTVRTYLMNGERLRDVLRIAQKAGPARLYSGLASDLAVNLPYSLLYMPVYEELKARGAPKPLSASCAVAVASLVTVPADIVTQRTQVGLAPNAAAAARDVFARGGVRGFYRGLSPTLMRLCPHHAVQWTMYESLCAMVRQRNSAERVSPGESALIGGTSGALAALVTQPLDVIKTRLQTGVGYKGVVHAAQRIAREEGLRAFGRGLVPRLLNIFPSTAIFYTVFEATKRALYADGQAKSAAPQVQAPEAIDDDRPWPIMLERVSPGGALVPPAASTHPVRRQTLLARLQLRSSGAKHRAPTACISQATLAHVDATNVAV